MSNYCVEFEALVKKFFGFLYDDWGFYIVDKRVSRFGDRCLLILRSNKLMIKIYRAPDEVNLLLGRLSAPLTWDNVQDGKEVWHYIRGIVRYLNHDLTSINSDGESWSERTIDVQMAELADMLMQHLTDICDFFGNDNFEIRRQDYLEFLDEFLGR